MKVIVDKDHFINILLFVSVFSVYAQQEQNGVPEESSASWSLLFDVQADRLLRSSFSDTTIKGYIEIARQTGMDGDWQTALELLSVVEAELSDQPPAVLPEPSLLSQFDILAVAGTEYWYQKFGLSLTQDDSTISERNLNPFIGLRVLYERAFTPKSRSRLDSEIKGSDKYFSQYMLLRHYAPLGHSRWVLENIFQYTDYKDPDGYRLLDNTTEIDVLMPICRFLDVQFTEEIQNIRYNKNTVYLSSFFQNKSEFSMIYSPFPITTEIHYYFKNRDYIRDRQRNYHEHVFITDFLPKTNHNFSLWARGQYSERKYHHEYVDSLYINNFKEWYFSCNLRYNIKSFIFRLDGEFESKTYQHYNTILPDYTDLVVGPSFSFHLISPLTLKIGYQYRAKMHGGIAPSGQNSGLEDFYAHGPVFAIDLLMGGGFMASIANNYKVRKYKDIFHDDYGLTLYTDKNTNSLYFFLTWNTFKHWEFSVLSNYDVEKEKYDDRLNMASNFINFELSYKF